MHDPMQPRPYRVARARREIGDTYTLDLAPAEGNPGCTFEPGQFNMLYVFGVGEVPISISGDPAAHDTLAHTVRDVGAVTRAITKLKKGDVLGVRGPFGSSWPVETGQGRDVVIVAGCIGLAPLRPAIYSILARLEEFGKVALLYGARSPAEVLYTRQQDRWRRSGLDVQVTVDRADQDWPGEVGVVTRLVPRVRFDPSNTIAMICGPEIMMRFTIADLEKLGVEEERIFVSMERNMKCAVGFCGHCQLGPTFVCKDGPVFPYSQLKQFFWTREV